MEVGMVPIDSGTPEKTIESKELQIYEFIDHERNQNTLWSLIVVHSK
jgi:hypothetical protein